MKIKQNGKSTGSRIVAGIVKVFKIFIEIKNLLPIRKQFKKIAMSVFVILVE